MGFPASDDTVAAAEGDRRPLRAGAIYGQARGARVWSVAFGPRDGPALVAVGGWRMYASRHAEDGPMINAAGLQTNAIIASISTERLTDEG